MITTGPFEAAGALPADPLEAAAVVAANASATALAQKVDKTRRNDIMASSWC